MPFAAKKTCNTLCRPYEEDLQCSIIDRIYPRHTIETCALVLGPKNQAQVYTFPHRNSLQCALEPQSPRSSGITPHALVFLYHAKKFREPRERALLKQALPEGQ